LWLLCNPWCNINIFGAKYKFKCTVCWNAMLWSVAAIYWHLEGTYCSICVIREFVETLPWEPQLLPTYKFGTNSGRVKKYNWLPTVLLSMSRQSDRKSIIISDDAKLAACLSTYFSLRSALLWDFTQSKLTASYQHYGATYGSYHQRWAVEECAMNI
jgi:hypothetical protein